ncbi:MAG TPA: hypothetical protein VFG53_00985 [Anaeromyxobacter sp.]|nr:hypothetical protein [Anaeromyxobacter sp.]
MKRLALVVLMLAACGPSAEDMNQEYLARRELAAIVAYGNRGADLRPYIERYKKRCAKCRPERWCLEEAERVQLHGQATLTDVVCKGSSGQQK